MVTETQSTIRVGTLIQSGYDFLKYAALSYRSAFGFRGLMDIAMRVPYYDNKNDH